MKKLVYGLLATSFIMSSSFTTKENSLGGKDCNYRFWSASGRCLGTQTLFIPSGDCGSQESLAYAVAYYNLWH
jgi:hypothetical protein